MVDIISTYSLRGGKGRSSWELGVDGRVYGWEQWEMGDSHRWTARWTARYQGDVQEETNWKPYVKTELISLKTPALAKVRKLTICQSMHAPLVSQS